MSLFGHSVGVFISEILHCGICGAEVRQPEASEHAKQHAAENGRLPVLRCAKCRAGFQNAQLLVSHVLVSGHRFKDARLEPNKHLQAHEEHLRKLELIKKPPLCAQSKSDIFTDTDQNDH